MSFFDNVKKYLFFAAFFAIPFLAHAQQFRPVIQNYLTSVKSKWKLTDRDISNWSASDQYTNNANGITYTYLQQEVAGIRVFNAISTMAIKNDAVVYFANRFIPEAANKANGEVPLVTPEEAVIAAANHLNVHPSQVPVASSKDDNQQHWIVGNCGIANQPMLVDLYYLPLGGSLRLVWNVNIELKNSSDWWNIRIDAQSGQFIEKNNLTVSCTFDNPTGAIHHDKHDAVAEAKTANVPATLTGEAYRVFALPVEAPTFGPRELLVDPFSPEASPYGWQDTNGIAGPELTITRGNNVHAYEDEADNNEPGYSPDAGASLQFDFPLDLNYGLDTNRDAIITNLYYVNNIIHDILYSHGFDEVAGNFQLNNYGKGGEGHDYVRAEAQDGSGTNNANFSTPDDGKRPRMQMYLWSNPNPTYIKVNTPVLIDNDFVSPEAKFSPELSGPFSGSLVLVNDGVGTTSDACQTIVNTAELAGKIAVIDRGSCSFLSQVQAAEAAGAIGVVVCNTDNFTPFAMDGQGPTGIPAVMISLAYGNLVKEQLAAGVPVEITIYPSHPIDASLDNGVIAHEFGHGVSNRLTGGPASSNCLFNAEQAGEGWSDWLALLLTIEPGDVGTSKRGMATYSYGEGPSGNGIRRVPYSTDMAINSQNYGDMAASTEVHNTGEIWAQTLWDLSWKLIDAEGFDPDWFNGVGGNHTALTLVLEGMKLQPCGPGFIDGRDAILAADELLYNNAHRCLIWEAFAGRGMGLYAVQGSADDATDQVADYEVPNFCKTPVAPPVANFTTDILQSCISTFQFNDLSTDLPQYWLWNFGDGTTSDEPNPSHNYTNPGTYTVTLKVTNSLGEDTHTLEVSYFVDPAPAVTGTTTVCAGNSTTLTSATSPGYTTNWYKNGNIVATGDVFTTDKLTAATTFQVRQYQDIPNGNVGPANNTFSNGTYQSSGPEGRLLFEAFQPFVLKTAFVYAKNAGVRTFKLYNQNNEVVQTVAVDVPDGPSRVTLNFNIPTPGKYSIGNAAQNLYRNFAGGYPYTIDNVVSIYASNYASSPSNFYYYLYDWEVTFCFSAPTPVTVNVTPGPVANFGAIVNGFTAQFNNNTVGSSTSYTWNFGDGSPVSNAVNPSHTYTANGTYTVILTVSNGTCSSSFEKVITIGTTGVNDINEPLAVNVFPNPATSEVNIAWSKSLSGRATVIVTDGTGRMVLTQPVAPGAQQISLNTGNLAAGVYYIRLTSTEGTFVRKVTVLHNED